LENVRLQPFENQPHDWYEEELKSVKPLEAGKRKAGELVFREKIERQVRRGGRRHGVGRRGVIQSHWQTIISHRR
jgi:hypothetical protein